MKITIPESVRAEAKKQAADVPVLLTAGDAEEFLKGLPPDIRADAEEHWNGMVEQNETRVAEFLTRMQAMASNVPKKTPYFLTVRQVATRWNVSDRTVWRMVRDGRLPSVLIGGQRRIRESGVERVEESWVTAA